MLVVVLSQSFKDNPKTNLLFELDNVAPFTDFRTSAERVVNNETRQDKTTSSIDKVHVQTDRAGGGQDADRPSAAKVHSKESVSRFDEWRNLFNIR